MQARPRLLAALAVAVVTGDTSAQGVSFSRDVLPILSDRCFQCHGPDERARKAELRLDVREDLLRPRDGYAIVAPGAPEQSELIARITSEDDDLMPPRHTKLNVTDAEVDVLGAGSRLARVVDTGRSPQQAPAPPPVRDRAWPRNDVDRFVLARLEAATTTPNAPRRPRRCCVASTST